ncbi:hypothetical protein [Salinisphaera japonica]|uniref:hypothetical protein n=1 Tax=Salinisphaera japonica TaxID=1304270 RepID=UPI000F4B44FE|nr:hypothetical protein [Salinisphaera japonica]
MVSKNERIGLAIDRGKSFEELRNAVKKRMRYLEFLAWFRGWVSRKDLMERFDIGPTAASSDFTIYSDAYPNNLRYDLKKKRYVSTPEFAPAFRHNLRRALQSLSSALDDDARSDTEVPIPVAPCPSIQRELDPSVVATICRSISTRSEIIANYTSMSSGDKARRLVPLALLSDGFQWRVRCFDRARSRHGFRDYMLARFGVIEQGSWESGRDISLRNDPQWSNYVCLEFAPHPKAQYRPAVLSSYDFDDQEVLRVNVRVAEVGYLLRLWPVDVTESALLSSNAYQLHLANSLQVQQIVENVTQNEWIFDSLAAEQTELAELNRR